MGIGLIPISEGTTVLNPDLDICIHELVEDKHGTYRTALNKALCWRVRDLLLLS